MKIELEIPDDKFEAGFTSHWEDDFEIKTEIQGNEFVIIANKEGLVSLAVQLLTLSQDKYPTGYHLHYDN
jgi:hypothetical protein